MKFLSQEHLHQSHITTQVQTLLSPYILPLLISLLVLIGYNKCLESIQSLTLDDNSSTFIGSVSFTNKTQVGLNTTSWKVFKDINEDLLSQQQNLYDNVFDELLNATVSQYESWRNITITSFVDSLDAVVTQYEARVEYSSTVKKLVQKLNDTVVGELVTQNTKLAELQTEISDSVSIGDSLDVSDLNINVTGISDDFDTVLSGLDFTEDDSLTGLHKSREDVLDDIESLFESALDKLDGFQLGTYNISNGTSETSITLIQGTSSSSVAKQNGTELGTSEEGLDSLGAQKAMLIALGCCIIVGYILVSILNHFHFQYASDLRKKAYLQSMESTSVDDYDEDGTDVQSMEDVEKGTRESEISEDNFNAIYHRLKNPTVTLLTDVVSRVSGAWYWTYWCVEYLTLRLPLLIIVMMSVVVVILGAGRADTAVSDVSLGASAATTEYTTEYEHTLNFTPLKLVYLDVSDEIEGWNVFVEDLNASITSSLERLFEEYNITAVLGMSPPQMSPITLKSTTDNTSRDYSLPNVTLSATTSLNVSTTSSVSMASVVANLVSKAARAVQQAVVRTCMLVLCVLGGFGVLILLIGVVYSMLM